MTHSPLPWSVKHYGKPHDCEILDAEGDKIYGICAGEPCTTDQNAQLMVNSVNHHDKLVEMLKEVHHDMKWSIRFKNEDEVSEDDLDLFSRMEQLLAEVQL